MIGNQLEIRTAIQLEEAIPALKGSTSRRIRKADAELGAMVIDSTKVLLNFDADNWMRPLTGSLIYQWNLNFVLPTKT